MPQDPNTAPYPRASYAQDPYPAAPYGQPTAQWPTYQQSTAQSTQQTFAQPAVTWPTQPQQQPTSFGAWPEPSQEDLAADLAKLRKLERKATRGMVGSGICALAFVVIFVYAAVNHQMDLHIETAGPVFMLIALVNARRFAKARTLCRAKIADLTRAV